MMSKEFLLLLKYKKHTNESFKAWIIFGIELCFHTILPILLNGNKNYILHYHLNFRHA